jgi:ParB/RepB/Spo0J family partition protein
MHVDRIHPHRGNIRESLGDLSGLAASIKAHGILQPIIVAPYPGKPGHYRIIGGHRRCAAALAAGLDRVPVTVSDSMKVPEVLMLVENMQRAGLNPMDKAEAMGSLRSGRNWTMAQTGLATGLSEATVSFYLALLELDKRSRARVRDGSLSAADAVAAVRRVRKRNRAREGKKAAGAVWEPDHFTSQHPLARRAAGLCAGREHSARRQIGKTVLVYDRPTHEGVLWRYLQAWWKETRQLADDGKAKATLYKRLRDCLPASSPPQRNLFDIYHHIHGDELPGFPALLPEVWLHWGPQDSPRAAPRPC